MRTHHRNKHIRGGLRLKKMCRCELRVVRNRIRSTDFKLNPEPTTSVDSLQKHVGPRFIAQQSFVRIVKDMHLRATLPAGWALSLKLPLQVGCKMSHLSHFFGETA
jgi:hypothetical protein